MPAKIDNNLKTILGLLMDYRVSFLIPDYQRPYEWEEKECQQLWDDIYNFAFPDGNCEKFDENNEEYFLGLIVTFPNDEDKKRQEVIDGQQRLTTLMLLFRAFYTQFEDMGDHAPENIQYYKQQIGSCIWKTNISGRPDMNSFKLESEVVTDETKQELKSILQTGKALNEQISLYAKNYRFFQGKITEYFQGKNDWIPYFLTRLLNNCVLLSIEVDSQDRALRIFSTLNDRGKPLSDSDIFKAQFYKYYAQTGHEAEFIKRWEKLEKDCKKVFNPRKGTPVNEAFTRYMYYAQAKQGEMGVTKLSLRKSYEKDNYALLKQDKTFDDIIDLVRFWNAVQSQDTDQFSDKILKRLFVLNSSSNSMWTYIVSVYYLTCRDENGRLNEDDFYDFLNQITAFIWTHMLMTKSVLNMLRPPLFTEMVNIAKYGATKFEARRFNSQNVLKALRNFNFTNSTGLTRMMLTWWAFHDSEQKWLPLKSNLVIEIIYSKGRQTEEHGLSNVDNLNAIGNKVLLEKRIRDNISSSDSDYRFSDKVKYYKGDKAKKQKPQKGGTQIHELNDLARTRKDFEEKDIIQRTEDIFSEFIQYLKMNDLLRD